MEKYPCIECGLCCRRVDRAVEAAKELGLGDFPYKWDETGRCEMLSDTNRCTVYETRPLICNIDAMIERFDLDKKEFYKLNGSACNEFLKQDNRLERLVF